MDLHSNNIVVGIVDSDGKRVAHQKLGCQLQEIVKFLAPYKKRLERLAVESTYNWYWLVDGLQAAGYPVVLAKAAKTSTVIATKALACKLAKAAWYLMAQAVDYQASRIFPELAARKALA